MDINPFNENDNEGKTDDLPVTLKDLLKSLQDEKGESLMPDFFTGMEPEGFETYEGFDSGKYVTTFLKALEDSNILKDVDTGQSYSDFNQDE